MTQGLLLVNKPSGPTSYDLIRWIKRKVKGPKIGHCGTLDPMASGLMLILLGRSATKRQAELMGQEKVYRCRLRLGVRTDSGDATGKIIETSPVPEITKSQLDLLARKLIGPQLQTPPMYSAIKKDGQPLYKLARKGQTIEREPRPITIYDFEFLNVALPEIEFRVRCSTGTYVRVLAEDIGKELGSIATMSFLVREKIGAYGIETAIPGESLKEMGPDQIDSKIIALTN